MFKASKYASVSHPCTKCTINKDEHKDEHDSGIKEEVPVMCLSHKGRVVETIVARLVSEKDTNK
jgi:hypothetical protein